MHGEYGRLTSRLRADCLGCLRRRNRCEMSLALHGRSKQQSVLPCSCIVKSSKATALRHRFCGSFVTRDHIMRHFCKEELSHGSMAFQHRIFAVQTYVVLFVNLTFVFILHRDGGALSAEPTLITEGGGRHILYGRLVCQNDGATN